MQQFIADESKTVLLMLLKTTSAGLTLVVANNVFLLEPSLDPAVEQQAVGRVHRVGQVCACVRACV